MTHPHAAADSIETLADLLGQLGGGVSNPDAVSSSARYGY